MSTAFTIEIDHRDVTGSAACRRLRRAGRIPGVIYGLGSAARPVAVNALDIGQVLHHAGLTTLTFAGGSETASVILKDVQRDPVSQRVLHVDFQEVSADQLITFTVVVEPHGVPAGAQQGGQLEQVLHELDIRCRPGDFPEILRVNVAAMKLDETMHVREVPLPEGVVAISDPDLAVFQVRLPKIDAAAEAAEAAEGPAEPEVIGRAKAEEAGEE